MDYCLGSDDGTAAIFDAAPDIDTNGDGILDAVGLDLDGDGLRDDALLDLDGDGLADHAGYDVDGSAPRWCTDDGSGTWALAAEPVVRGSPLRWTGLDGSSHEDVGPVDVDGDGRAGERLFDDDGDGLADRIAGTAEDGSAFGFLDTDGDGRWDLKFVDVDGDGTADFAGPVS
ncbi:MAG: pullulanase [Mycolicibacterium sp.]|nr:pullulanase [Mycolicibacterium sp.]